MLCNHGTYPDRCSICRDGPWYALKQIYYFSLYFVIYVLTVCVLMVGSLRYAGAQEIQRKYEIGKTYTMGASVCRKLEDVTALKDAELAGGAEELYNALAMAGECGNLIAEYKLTKLIGHFKNQNGTEIYQAEAEVEAADGTKVTVYISITSPIIEVSA